MHAYEILFSPTGGTAKVAAALTTDWSSVKTIDLSIPSTHYEDICLESDSLAVIAMPAFGGAAPQLALDRLSRIRGNGALCMIAAVYGNRAYEDTLVLLEDYAQTAGFQVIAAVSAVAEHSIIHQYAAGRPNSADCQELAAFGRQILQKAISGNRSVPEIPGNRPSKHSETGMVPNVKHSCTSCGLCAQKCPAGAIPLNNCKTTDKTKCISCMRCVSLCPVHAREVNPVMTAVAAKILKKSCTQEKANELFL